MKKYWFLVSVILVLLVVGTVLADDFEPTDFIYLPLVSGGESTPTPIGTVRPTPTAPRPTPTPPGG